MKKPSVKDSSFVPETVSPIRIDLPDQVIEIIRPGTETATIGQSAGVRISLVGVEPSLPESVVVSKESALVQT